MHTVVVINYALSSIPQLIRIVKLLGVSANIHHGATIPMNSSSNSSRNIVIGAIIARNPHIGVRLLVNPKGSTKRCQYVGATQRSTRIVGLHMLTLLSIYMLINQLSQSPSQSGDCITIPKRRLCTPWARLLVGGKPKL